MAGRIYIGISGFSYPDWKGIVYIRPKIDQLEYVSGFRRLHYGKGYFDSDI